jgi:glyoxylase-like metal-dependent hydrolase (beta-lactamase superfamily II)
MKMNLHESDIVTIPLPTPFPVGKVNAFLVKTDPLILVDAGVKTDEAYQALSAGLAEHNVAVSDIEAILITHGHVDHMGMLGRLQEESGAASYAHAYVADRLRDFEESERQTHDFALEALGSFGAPDDIVEASTHIRNAMNAYTTPVPIDNAFDDGDKVFAFTVHHVPGHSPSDCLFVNTPSASAITGDHVLDGITPNPLIRRPRRGETRARSLVEYRRSLMHTRALDLAVCYPGHGGPILDHRAVIDQILRRQDIRTEKVRAILAEGETTVYDLCQKLFNALDLSRMYLALSAAVGHLELLEEEGGAISENRGGIIYYRAVP